MLKATALATVILSANAFGNVGGQTYRSLADSRREIRAVYESLSTIYNHEDLDGVMSWVTPDFKWTLMDGTKLNRAAAKASMKDLFDSTQTGHWHIDLLNTVIAGPMATVVAQYRFDGVLLDPSHKPYKATFIDTERQNWLRTPSGWRQMSESMLTQKTYAGGLKATPNVNSTQPGTGNDKPPASASGKGK